MEKTAQTNDITITDERSWSTAGKRWRKVLLWLVLLVVAAVGLRRSSWGFTWDDWGWKPDAGLRHSIALNAEATYYGYHDQLPQCDHTQSGARAYRLGVVFPPIEDDSYSFVIATGESGWIVGLNLTAVTDGYNQTAVWGKVASVTYVPAVGEDREADWKQFVPMAESLKPECERVASFGFEELLYANIGVLIEEGGGIKVHASRNSLNGEERTAYKLDIEGEGEEGDVQVMGQWIRDREAMFSASKKIYPKREHAESDLEDTLTSRSAASASASKTAAGERETHNVAVETSSGQARTFGLVFATGSPTVPSGASLANPTSTSSSKNSDDDDDDDDEDKKPALPRAAVIGITISAVVVLAILGAVLFIFLRRRQEKKKPKVYPEIAYLYTPTPTPSGSSRTRDGAYDAAYEDYRQQAHYGVSPAHSDHPSNSSWNARAPVMGDKPLGQGEYVYLRPDFQYRQVDPQLAEPPPAAEHGAYGYGYGHHRSGSRGPYDERGQYGDTSYGNSHDRGEEMEVQIGFLREPEHAYEDQGLGASKTVYR